MTDVPPVMAFAFDALHAQRVAALEAFYAESLPPPPRRPVAKPIVVNGQRFESTLDAARTLGVSMTKIREVVRGVRVIAGLTAVYCK